MMTSEMERIYYERKIEELTEENKDLRQIIAVSGFLNLLLTFILL